MTEIRYVEGDASIPWLKEHHTIIAHIVNDKGLWGAGFTKSLSLHFPSLVDCYYQWAISSLECKFKLGKVQFFNVGNKVHVANMLAQHGTYRPCDLPRTTYVQYDALERCLESVSLFAKKLHSVVQMPRIGCGLGGGKWKMVEPIIKRTLCHHDIEVYVMDWPKRKE